MNTRRNLATGASLLGLALLASATLLGCACQRARHGVILRGQWSLELNRVPWVSSRTMCECDSGQSGDCLPGAAVSAGCHENGPSETRSQLPGEGTSSPREAHPAPLPAPQTAPNEMSRSTEPVRCGIVPRLLAGRPGCRPPHRLIAGASRVIAGAPGATPLPAGSQEHSRFHPVPTQPVFASRGRPAAISPSNWRGQAAPNQPGTSGLQPSAPPIQIQIAPPEVESGGDSTNSEDNQPEPPKQKQDRLTDAPAPLKLDVSAAKPSWIFTNPAQSEKQRLPEPLFDEPPVHRIARPEQNRNR